MLKNLESTKGLIFSQEIMIELTKQGMKREDAYRLVQKSAKKSMMLNKNLVDLIIKDKKITNRISERKIKEIFIYKKHFKNINHIFKRVFK